MIRSCVRQAVRAFAGAAFFSCALAASAGSITLSDSNCDSFSLSGSPGNQTLTCVVSNAPTGCSIQGPGTGTNGNAITLTAVCATGSPTTYAWSGGNCAGVATQSCQAVDSNITRNYSVVISNAIGPGSPNPATKSVVWSASLPNKPTGCTITPTPSSLPAGGGSVSLTAQCSGGDPVDTWTWGGATFTTQSGNIAAATISASTTFTIQATNGGGTGNGSVPVSVAGGGGGGPQSCAGYLSTSNLTLNWPLVQNGNLAMGTLDAAVVTFTTGSSTGSGQVTLSTAGNNAATHHDYTLSASPCDFGAGLKNAPSSGGPTIRFKVGSSGQGVPLSPNTTYYINVKNSEDGTGCQSSGMTCNLFPINLTGF